MKGFIGLCKIFCLIISVSLMISCGGGGQEGGSRYTIGGTVEGLEGGSFEFYFQYSDSEFIYEALYVVTGNEPYTLDINFPDGAEYTSRITRMPEDPSQVCYLENAQGRIAGSSVSNLNIRCHTYKDIVVTTSYTGSRSTYGLSLSLKMDQAVNIYADNPADGLELIEEAVELDSPYNVPDTVFTGYILKGSSYELSLISEPYPSDQHRCYINNASGHAGDENINIHLDCYESGIVEGVVAGLEGGEVTLVNQDSSIVLDHNGAFTFPVLFPLNSEYHVVVDKNPSSPNQKCVVKNGEGVLSSSGPTLYVSRVSDIVVSCYSHPELQVTSLSKEVVLNWPDLGEIKSNLYYSSDRNFTVENYHGYEGGTLLEDVSSNLRISDLENNKGYYFVLESIFDDGSMYSHMSGGRPSELVLDGAVNAVVTDGSGNVYLGGNFNKVRARSGQGVPLSTYSNSLSIADYPLVNGRVTASISDGDGGWYIGGEFTKVGDQDRHGMAHILNDGSVDAAFHPDVTGTIINAIYLLNDVVYVGGEFTAVDGAPRENFAAIGIDGNLKSWSLNADNAVESFASSGSTIFMGGKFSNVGGFARSSVAAFDETGMLTEFSVDISGIISSMFVHGDELYVCGKITSLEGENKSGGVFALDMNGVFTGWSTAGNKSGIVKDCVIHNDIVFYSGYLFTSDTIEAKHLNGTEISWPDGIQSGYVEHLAIVNNTLIAAGDFSVSSDDSRMNIAAYNLNDIRLELVSDLSEYYVMSLVMNRWSPEIDNDVTSISVSGDAVYIGGNFNGLGGEIRNYLSSIDVDGVLTEWNPNPDNIVYSMAEKNGSIFIGGQFTQMNGQNRMGLAVVDSSGNFTDFYTNIGGGYSPVVYSLCVDDDYLYVGGWFSSINGFGRSNLASFQLDGTLTIWSPDMSGSVKSIEKGNSDLYVAGDFLTVDGFERHKIANFDSAGDLTDWTVNIDGSVNALLVLGGSVYFGGSIDSVNGEARTDVAAVDENGVLLSWSPFVDGDVNYKAVNSLEYYQGNIVVGGYFDAIDGQSRDNLFSIGEDAVLDDWAPGPNGVIYDLHVDNGELYMGGNFIGVSNDTRSKYAVFDINGVLR